jgi:hypothetical protein
MSDRLKIYKKILREQITKIENEKPRTPTEFLRREERIEEIYEELKRA